MGNFLLDNKENKTKSFTELNSTIDVASRNNTFNKKDKLKASTGLENNIDVSTSNRCEHSPCLFDKDISALQEENKDDMKFTAYIFENGASIRYWATAASKNTTILSHFLNIIFDLLGLFPTIQCWIQSE